ncbi:hypothetical protein [Microlunatus sp. Y2014]|uniref:hypothetical protein n=1 Tax=Microlunatus sp. Y2014 TaxID=3418488 RepID=UPI003DA6D1E0
MNRRLAALMTCAALLATLLVAAPAPKAHAQAYCNVYAPSRVSVWSYFQQVNVTYGAGCGLSGTEFAWWSLVHPSTGQEAVMAYPDNTWFDFYSFNPTGRYTVRPEGGYDINYDDITQNTSTVEVRLGSVAYISAARSGGYHVITARTYHYSPNYGRIVATGSRTGQVQYRPVGTTTWRAVATITTGSNGHWTGRTWSPGAREYRVVFGDAGTLWSATSATLHAG